MTWETKKLKEVCDFQSGLWKGKKEPFTSAYVIRNTNFTKSGELSFDDVAELEVESKQMEKRTLQPGDIILEKSGGGERTPVGRVCYFNKESEKPFSLSNFTARLRVRDRNELYPLFLHRFLYALYFSGKTQTMQEHSTGIRNLQLIKYKEIDIPLPSRPVQKQIVEKLDTTFADIDKAIRATEKNIENAEALLNAQIHTTLLSFSDCKKYKLGDICTATQGIQIPKSQQKKEPQDGYVRYLYISDFSHSNNLKYVPNDYPKKIVLPSDIIVVNTGASAGNIFRGIDGVLSNNLFKVSVKEELINPDFLYIFVKSHIFKSYQADILRGAANPHMGHKNFLSTPIHLPNLDKQNSVTSDLNHIETLISRAIRAKQEKLLNLNSLKFSILDRAFSGELTKDAA